MEKTQKCCSIHSKEKGERFSTAKLEGDRHCAAHEEEGYPDL